MDNTSIVKYVVKHFKAMKQGLICFMIFVVILTLMNVSDQISYPQAIGKRYINPICHGMDKRSLLELQAVYVLNENERDRLYSILSGNVTRKSIELVISRYRENINWSNMYASIRTVYDKSELENSIPFTTCQRGKVVKLPNVGRESQTYLYHIVHNYDNLADVTVFSQGAKPTRGYRGHRHGGGHLMANSTIHDFIINPEGHFVFNSAIWLPTIAHVVRTGYNLGRIPRALGLSQCPIVPLDRAEGREAQFSFDNTPVLPHIAQLCEKENSTWCSGPKFWDEFIRLPHPPHGVVFFSQGALFSVTADKIRRRPLEDYQRLLNLTSTAEDTSAGFFLEWFWYYLLTSDSVPCKISGFEFEWALNRPFYETFDFPKRVKFSSSKSQGSTFEDEEVDKNHGGNREISGASDLLVLKACPESGSDSLAPKNLKSFEFYMTSAVNDFRRAVSEKAAGSSLVENVIIYTTVNAEAAAHNLPPFLRSLALLKPPLTANLIVMCLDQKACQRCSTHLCGDYKHLIPCYACVYMDLGIAGASLAPGFSDELDRDYWRLTYGRVFATLKLLEHGFSTLAVDVDTVFLSNPFDLGAPLSVKPDHIAVVQDRLPFELGRNDDALINGGFLFYPANTDASRNMSLAVVKKIWSLNCRHLNEQIVTTKVLRSFSNTALPNGDSMLKVQVLSRSRYISFCSESCGTKKFEQITSLGDLRDMEKENKGLATFENCELRSRRRWSFFHAACIKWPNETKALIANGKGKAQQAVLDWLQ